MNGHIIAKIALSLIFGIGVSACSKPAPQSPVQHIESAGDVAFFVLVKSNNYAQGQDGDLTLLNYRFFSEVFPRQGGKIRSARLTRVADGRDLPYVDRGEKLYYEGGHFNTVKEVDAEFVEMPHVVDSTIVRGGRLHLPRNGYLSGSENHRG